MSNVHIFRETDQSATDYLDHNFPDGPMRCTNAPRSVLPCHSCGRRRWAKNLLVHAYYDGHRFFCIEGHVWNGRRRRFVTKLCLRPAQHDEEKER